MGIQIGSNYAGPCTAGEDAQHDPDGALPDGEHNFASLETQGLDSFHAGVHGLDKRRLFVGDVVGDANRALPNDPVHHPYVFGETAAGGLESGGAADFFVGGALGEGFVAAVVALAAGDVVEDDDAIARMEIGDAFTDDGDDTGSFVSEDAWGGVGSGMDFLEIGAAHAAGVDADEQFAGADAGDGNGFESDVVDAAVYGGEHSRGD